MQEVQDIRDKVLKHHEQTRTMHWIHALAFFVLGLTGVIFYFKWTWLANLFGGPANVSVIHRWAGVIFAAGPTIYILLNFERFAKFIDTISSISKDDIKWLKVMGGYIPFLKADNIPPQDKYNAGQKMLGWMIIIGSILIIFTGFPMWIWSHAMPPVVLAWCYNIHLWVAVIMCLLVGGHFFLAAIHPKSRVEFSSMMLDGMIDAKFTAGHNSKWFQKLKKDQ